jgi:hypothetical protein
MAATETEERASNPFRSDTHTFIAPETYLEQVRSRSCYSTVRGVIFVLFMLLYTAHGIIGVAAVTAFFNAPIISSALAPAALIPGILFSLLASIITHQLCRIAADIADLLIHSGARNAG